MDTKAFLAHVTFKRCSKPLVVTVYGVNSTDAEEKFLADYRPIVATINVSHDSE